VGNIDIKLISHTRLSSEFLESLPPVGWHGKANERAVVALTAIRTCYSPNNPADIAWLEGDKYFGKEASDGEGGTEADRLFRHIQRSGHASVTEHLTYTFAIEGVSRSLLAQLTRHRQFSFSVQSQRYVKFGSQDRSQGFDYVTPPSISAKTESEHDDVLSAHSDYETAMAMLQCVYDRMRAAGVPAEDARYVLPNAAATNLVMTGNLRALIEFYGKRNERTHAQWEIAALSEAIKREVTAVDAWVAPFFDNGGDAE
jgi:thymidylate synthase (FAD)